MFSLSKYKAINADLVATLLGNRRCHGNHYVRHLLRVMLMLAHEYEVHVTTHNGVTAHFTCIHYMPV